VDSRYRANAERDLAIAAELAPLGRRGLANVRSIAHAQEIHEDEMTMTFPRRGEICFVDFDPSRGHEIQKTRPAVITSKVSPTPCAVEVGVAPSRGNGLTPASAIHLGQIRSVDCTRLTKRIGALDAATMRKVDDSLKISLGLSAL
jgi:mRNA interferase MazF